MSRPVRTLQLLLLGAIVSTFAAAELMRTVDQVRATALSMLGWGLFTVLFLAWLWEECGVREGLRRLVRVLVLAGIAFSVLCLYYRRSQIGEAGVEVDATYTFIGLGEFVAMHSPITFAGRTTSFAQFPMALLGHLPTYLVGFDRLGPFAIHATILLQVALLLACLTVFVVDRGLPVQAIVVAFVAAVFSNRLTVLVCNLTGYAIPSIAIPIALLVTVLGERSFSAQAPRVGGLLTLSLLHHYPGFFFALPLAGLWVVAGRNPWMRLTTFLRLNLPLCATVLVAALSIGLHPEMLLPRIRAVTTPTLSLDELRVKLEQNWVYLSGPFPAAIVQTFLRRSRGSWHLLDVPPLGGHLAAILAANWIVTAIALGRRGVVYVAHLVVLAACLAALTVAQHLITGFEHYRDMTFVLGLATAGIGFVLLVPRVGRVLRPLVIAYGVAVALHAYVDVAVLAGKRYAVVEYAPMQQAMLESMRAFWRDGGDVRLGHATVITVVNARFPRFPLEPLYRDAAAAHGLTLEFVLSTDFCDHAAEQVQTRRQAACSRVGVAIPASICPAVIERFGWRKPRTSGGTALYVFENACGAASDPSPPELIELP